jgi:hypothetical protein
MGKKIIVTESQMRRLLDKMINESKMGIDELDYQSYTEGDDLQQLRDAIEHLSECCICKKRRFG